MATREPTLDEGGGEAERERVRVAAVATADGGLVLAGRELEFLENDQADVRRVLTWTLPFVLGAGTLIAWLVIGRALRPVESMRSDVDGIVTAGSGRRIEDPATGDEIARLAHTMNEMLDRVDDSAATRRQFLSDASHELKSPAANIRALVETHGTQLTDQEWADLRDGLVAEAGRVQRLVDDLLYLAREDERPGTTEESENLPLVDLDDLVFGECEAVAATTDLPLDASGVGPADVRGDGEALARTVRNLLENAVRHADSTIVVALGQEDDSVLLTVEDDGSGIDPADRDRVFDRFVRLDAARAREKGGTGLGLAIVAETVRRHGGRVAVDDAPLGGARFTLHLPLRDEASAGGDER